jgi:hypothetical protein
MSVIATTFGGNLVWSFVSEFEVIEGVLAVAALLPLSVVMESWGVGSTLDSTRLNNLLRSRLSPLFALLGAGGALSFVLLVLCNSRKVCSVLDVNGVNIVQYPLAVLGFIGGSALGQNGQLGYGALALVIWILTLGALSIPMGFARAVKFFALPSILFLTIAVLLFDPREMDSQAINLVSQLTFDGVSLLSNWFLLTVSLFFTVYGLTRGRLGASGQARNARGRGPGGLSLGKPMRDASRAHPSLTRGSAPAPSPCRRPGRAPPPH